MLKKVLAGVGLTLAVMILAFLFFVGPWPTYAASDVTTEKYYERAIASADASLAQTSPGTQGKLLAGWSSARITPEIGVPLAGFGDREGNPSTGVHDQLHVKAVAVSDGTDTAVLVGSDMLIVPDNIADRARAMAMAATKLQADDILFNATHTHSGPGAWAPGLAASLFGGSYNEAVMEAIGEAFGVAIISAYNTMKPASIGVGDVDVPEHIKNRAHEGPVDSELNYLVLKHENGSTCHVVSYGAHATVVGSSNMEFSGDYPGYLERAIETKTGGLAIFLAGAVGSMGPQIEGAEAFAKAEALGTSLADKVLAGTQNLEMADSADVAAVGFSFKTPSLQMRLNQDWRLSPYLFPFVGLDDKAWISGVKIGNVFLYGTPCDMSGEISIDMKSWAEQQGVDLWVLSFAGDYVGYVSPQKYYGLPRNETHEYEMYLMSWMGPNQEPFFTEILHHLVGSLGFAG